MITADFHIHTFFSTDSDAAPEDIISEAAKKGLKTICFTDHMDCEWPYNNKEFIFNPDEYFSTLLPIKDKYKGIVDVRIGMELGLREEASLYEKLNPYYKSLGSLPFDFIIGSTHLVDYDDPYYDRFWEGKDTYERILRYYEATLFNASSYDDFDVYGHLDYISRYIPEGYHFEETRFMDICIEILKTLVSKGKGIEINTKSLSKGGKRTNPDATLLSIYRQLGGEIITVGSDAHHHELIGTGFNYVRDLLEKTGFKYYTVFRNRKPEFIAL